MNITLTKEAEKTLCMLYKDYLVKRKAGSPKSLANYWDTSHVIHESLLPKWLFKDVDDTCRELSRSQMINCGWGDNIALCISISDSGMIYMENKFKNGLKDVISFLSNFIP